MHRPRLLFVVRQKQGQSLWADKTNMKPGLSNSVETTVEGLIQHGINAEIRYVPDGNFIHEVVCSVKPDVVIIEAYWVNSGKIQLLKQLHPGVHWMVRNHSEVPFLAEEGSAGAWNCEYLKMGIEVTSVSARTVEDLMPLVNNLKVDPCLLTHLPNVYLSTSVPRVRVKDVPKDEIHIGCFGAVRTMKNHLQQAMGSIDYAGRSKRKLYFHINGSRIEGNGSQPIKNLRKTFERLYNCELVEHHWMDKTTFYNLLRERIDVVLQCSLTESFNIIAADAVLCSVPTITSPEVRWLSKYYHCDPNSAVSISNRLEQLFDGDQAYLQTYIDDQLLDLDLYNERSVLEWTKRFL